jgi:GH15 family glucan-1,4-alpha-glucosidase
MTMTESPYPPIADYAIVGDCHTSALIARDSSVDWLCPRRFDAPAVFCRLLDAHKGGYFRSAPAGHFETNRRYHGATNVLQTELSGSTGRVRLTDFLPVHQRTSHRRGYDVGSEQRFLRLVEGLGGDLELQVDFKPTFDFARGSVDLNVCDGGVVAHANADYLTLACPGVQFQIDNGRARGTLKVREGERHWLELTFCEDADRARDSLKHSDCDQQLQRTLDYWERWADQCTYHGAYRDEVVRSALVLKLLTYEPTGAIVAAPTTSLPEQLGGNRNWDYRFIWLRDASLILYALMTLGYEDEAADFVHWLEDTIGSDSTRGPQIMYGIDSRRALPEHTLDHLDGYHHSKPVRVGNAAATQEQIDVYGEVLRAAALHYRRGHASPNEAWPILRGLVDQAADHWQDSGRGIWEVRGDPQPFTYGKLMCWSALDAGIKLARDHGLSAAVDDWRRARDAVREAILKCAYSEELGAFTQAFGSQNLDASALIIPRIGFLPPTDPRVRSTVDRIYENLTRDGLVYRYRTPDGLQGGEGTFTLCTFWLADALALSGEMDRAHAVFTRASRTANDVGLLAEEIDPTSGAQLGNFPQGFSHLALIGAAVDLSKSEKHGREDSARTEVDRAHGL